MQRGFAAEVRRIILFGVITVIFGLMNGYLSWTLIVGGGAYMGWMLWQIRQLDIWLHNSRSTPPDAGGIWGDIFDRITRLQNRQQKEKERMRAVLKRGQETTAAIRDGIVLISAKGNIDWFNQPAQLLLDFNPDDKGYPLLNFIRHPAFISYYENGNYGAPLDLPAPRGDKHLQYQLNRFGQGERLLVVRDITHIHRLEQMRKDFVANVSHELRTPLTVIHGYVETLLMTPDLPAKWEKALLQMEQQSQRMTDLISDLITLSQLETSNTEKQQAPVYIRPLLQTIRNDAQALSGEKQQQIILECPDNLVLIGSSKELQSAFSNLVFNAVKYCPANAAITITATANESGARLSVSDNGPGIDPIHIPRLTERFYRVDNSRTSSTGGTGLGLAIVKHILLRHNARLEISSKLHKGSSFTCVFPASRLA